MVNLKEYFYNLNRSKDSEIMKFIFEFTSEFKPFLLLSLNKDFINTYLEELQIQNEYSSKTDNYFGDLINSEVIERDTNILVRIYEFSNNLYETKEERAKFENLSYIEHRKMSEKIQDFQYCIHKIINDENIKLTTELSKVTSHLENNENPFPSIFINLEVYRCFEEYTKKHIIEIYIDYSYLKKRLEKERLIHKHTDNDFVIFLFDEAKLINDKDKENYYGKYESKLRSLRKSSNINRVNNFNNIFANLI